MTARSRWWAAALAVAGGWAGSRIRRVEVVGDSMRPTLEPGDRLVLLRSRRVGPGALVAVTDPRQARRIVVKRVADVSDGGLTVLGDNPAASTDSRAYGPVAPAAVRGRVVYRYHPPTRRGRLPLGRATHPL